MNNQILNLSNTRLPSILLIASPIAFMAVIVSAILGFSNVGVFDQITPQQMATIRVAWTAVNTFAGIAVFLGVAGVVALADFLRTMGRQETNVRQETKVHQFAWISLVSGIVVMVLCIVYILLRISVTGFTETTLGLNRSYLFSDWAFTGLIGPLSMIATIFVSIGLFISGFLRRTGLVIGILSAVLLVLSIVAGFPPFIFAFLWLILGVGLLLRKG